MFIRVILRELSEVDPVGRRSIVIQLLMYIYLAGAFAILECLWRSPLNRNVLVFCFVVPLPCNITAKFCQANIF
jgi:hypothetical protein